MSEQWMEVVAAVRGQRIGVAIATGQLDEYAAWIARSMPHAAQRAVADIAKDAGRPGSSVTVQIGIQVEALVETLCPGVEPEDTEEVYWQARSAAEAAYRTTILENLPLAVAGASVTPAPERAAPPARRTTSLAAVLRSGRR